MSSTVICEKCHSIAETHTFTRADGREIRVTSCLRFACDFYKTEEIETEAERLMREHLEEYHG